MHFLVVIFGKVGAHKNPKIIIRINSLLEK